MFTIWIHIGCVFLILCGLCGIGLAECKIQVSAIDGAKNALAEVQFRLINHGNFAEVKKTGKTAAPENFDFTEGIPYTIWAKKEGFSTSVIALPRHCANSSMTVAIVMLTGDPSRNVFIAESSQARDRNGKLYYGVDEVYAIGQSWPRPGSGGPCRSDCEVIVNLEISEDGNVTSSQTASGNPTIRRAVESAVKIAKFKPVYLGGVFVPVTATMRFAFK